MDKTLKYYDVIYKDWMSQERTEEELNLMIELMGENKGKILDVGCGTGRHLLPLLRMEFDVAGLEPSEEMREILLGKDNSVELIEDGLIDYDPGGKQYDLVVLMWNAFSEIAQSDDEAEIALRKLFSLVENDGIVLISCSDGTDFEQVDSLNFEYEMEEEGKKYKLTWKVDEFDEEKKITKCIEIIEVFGEDGEMVDIVSGRVTQKWWERNKLVELGEKCGFEIEVRELKFGDGDLYYVMKKK